ncbi:hypothetical protein [Psychrobacter sp. LV10R520-6]|uniref:hypothetical protein n=1 Tax=Psychrobacter sp. LV10R520-6 TaxID=1415574 RepID=UPI0024C9A973|nr:hypothetical protein [Psychrobacter sp. LV10R520-6]SNT69851.1 tRNA synthetases class I (C) catalytic domain-containing protein [Psychrobacter sp. LV10R520-6]
MTGAVDISIFNMLQRCKEPLVTVRPDEVSVCGPTVYNYAHLGNARPAVVFDVLVQLLKTRYRRVTYTRNFTDVDDKINQAASEQGCSIFNIKKKEFSGDS